MVPHRRRLCGLPHSHSSMWVGGHKHQNQGLSQNADSWARARRPVSELGVGAGELRAWISNEL